MALGRFFAVYLDVLDAEQVLDYTELVHRARIALGQPDVFETVTRDADAVLVDDYPELDPAQMGLVAALVPGGARLLAVGDPHTVLSAFRGAHPRAVADFPALFTHRDGAPGRVAELVRGHRQGGELARAVSGVARRFAVPVVGGVAASLLPEATPRPGSVAVFACVNETAQAQTVAAEVRRARLAGLSFADMAVVLRSGSRGVGTIARALARAGVPVRVAAGDMPLAQARPVQALMAALGAVAGGAAESDIELLLASPLCGLDPVAVRRVVRAHRELVDPRALPVAARLVSALDDPSWCQAAVGTPWQAAVERFARFAELLRRARGEMEHGRPADELAWHLWRRSGWAALLESEAVSGGALGVRAESDLEALRAFFAFAGEGERRGGVAGIRMLLAEVEAQQIPADYEREARRGGQGVDIMTVHRAKGREWPLVIVVGANEGQWPSPRHVGGHLVAERLVSDGLVGHDDPREHVVAERRSFYAACAAAGQRLVVTYVSGTADEAAPPSRFVADLGVEATAVADDEALDLRAFAASLRREATSPESSRARREAAASVLGTLAQVVRADGAPLVPLADPSAWWGMRGLSGEAPQGRTSVTLSPSQVTSLLECPRRYFLAREAKADAGTSGAQWFGSLVHRLVQRAQDERLDADGLASALDEAWADAPYESPWVSDGQRAEARRALIRFLAWQRQRSDDVAVVGVERPFRLELPCDGVDVTLAGTVDRLERLPDGRLQVVDFKTASTPYSVAKTAGLEQLGVYQLAIDDGAFGGANGSAGAVLVFLRSERAGGLPTERVQASLRDRPHLAVGETGAVDASVPTAAAPPGSAPGTVDEATGVADGAPELAYPTWVHERLARAAGVVRDGTFPATPGDHCRQCSFGGSCPASASGKGVLR